MRSRLKVPDSLPLAFVVVRWTDRDQPVQTEVVLD